MILIKIKYDDNDSDNNDDDTDKNYRNNGDNDNIDNKKNDIDNDHVIMIITMACWPRELNKERMGSLTNVASHGQWVSNISMGKCDNNMQFVRKCQKCNVMQLDLLGTSFEYKKVDLSNGNFRSKNIYTARASIPKHEIRNVWSRSGRDILCIPNFNMPVQNSKMDVVACAQLSFQMLTPQTKNIYTVRASRVSLNLRVAMLTLQTKKSTRSETAEFHWI